VFRIFALVLIGDAGWREIAARGFHSQAGWIAFCMVALGLLMASRRLQWVSAMPLVESTAIEYSAAPYLVPFMAIMGAGILSQAMTAHFEWPYALRLLAAAITLWIFRRRYGDIDWRFGWMGIGAGLLVFLLWVGLDRLVHGSASSGSMPSELDASSIEVRLAWLVTRIASAVLAVPVAEELTFRGFILRRLMNADFETVSWHSWNWIALGGSSILFGILHGGHWLAGIMAGAIFGGVMVRRGRLGDSIAAHAIANALLATYILNAGRWDLW
jgi:exosortase E/protease (VPEID-CTERM system)